MEQWSVRTFMQVFLRVFSAVCGIRSECGSYGDKQNKPYTCGRSVHTPSPNVQQAVVWWGPVWRWYLGSVPECMCSIGWSAFFVGTVSVYLCTHAG